MDTKTDKNNPQKESGQVLKKLKALWADKRPFKKRFLLSGAAMLAFCFTFIFFGPLELVAFSSDSFLFSYQDVVWTLALFAVLICAVGALLISLLRGKIFNYFVSVIFAITLGGYIQSLCLNGSLGTLTGDAIAWDVMTGQFVIGVIVWTLIILAVFFLMYLTRDIWSKAVTYLSLLLVIMQIAPTIGILCGAYNDSPKKVDNYTLSTTGMYEYSQNDNVFVFVLDRLDYDYITRVMKKEPEFFDRLDGFTGYDNAISAFSRTEPALNQLLTGCEEMAHYVSEKEFFKESWFENGRDLLKDVSEQGYSLEFYTEVNALFSDPSYFSQYVKNADNGIRGVNQMTAFSKLMQLSAFRYSPIFCKPFFWADTNYYNQDVIKDDYGSPYGFDDAKFGPLFAEATADREQNAFKFYHLNGPHAPYNINADGTYNKNGTDVEAQLMGTMGYLYGAFDRMKELGIYDDATIIITADHGDPISDYDALRQATRIGLFYKPSGSFGTKLQWSSAPVCTDNIPATIIKSVGGDYTNYGTPLDEISEDDEITRYYYKCVCDESQTEIEICKYEVIGNAADFKNWKLIKRENIEHPFY